MTTYVAFLRAVNVGGTGRLPMAELRKMCDKLGFTEVQTYIASGNVVFTSQSTKLAVKNALEEQLCAYAGKPTGVAVRTAAQVRAILSDCPFDDKEPKFTLAMLFEGKPPKDALSGCVGQDDEQLHLGAHAVYVYYPSGMGRSKLRIPAARTATARNMNTIRKMSELVQTKPAG